MFHCAFGFGCVRNGKWLFLTEAQVALGNAQRYWEARGLNRGWMRKE
jgi:hypothetical protein